MDCESFTHPQIYTEPDETLRRAPAWHISVEERNTRYATNLFNAIRRRNKIKSVLEIGCGTGTNVITLARRGWQVTGIDFAPRAVSLAKRKLRNEGVQAQLQVADATRLNGISGPFELAFDLGCFHGIPAPGRARYLDQLDRVLAPGGSWLMYTFLKPETDPPGTGLTEADLQAISTRMALVSRRDGVDTTRGRASAWFLFQRNGVLS